MLDGSRFWTFSVHIGGISAGSNLVEPSTWVVASDATFSIWEVIRWAWTTTPNQLPSVDLVD